MSDVTDDIDVNVAIIPIEIDQCTLDLFFDTFYNFSTR